MSSIDVSLSNIGFRRIAEPDRKGAALAQVIETYRGDETSPRWHSQWAWDNYEKLVVDLSQRLGLRESARSAVAATRCSMRRRRRRMGSTSWSTTSTRTSWR